MRESVKKLWTFVMDWGTYGAAVGVAAYALGYLVLRYEHRTLGIPTDLPLVDERYLFAGARFLLSFLQACSTLALVAVATLLVYILLPGKARHSTQSLGRRLTKGTEFMWSTPNRVAISGTAFSVIFFQLFMTHCLAFRFVLLKSHLPTGGLKVAYRALWKLGAFTAESELPMFWFFCFIVAGTLLSVALLGAVVWRLGWLKNKEPASQYLVGLFAAMVAIQVLFLPVNYGTLLAPRDLPRLEYMTHPNDLKCKDGWLVYRGKKGEGVTFLVRENVKGRKARRSLVTVPLSAVKEIRATQYDSILRELFGEGALNPRKECGSTTRGAAGNEAKKQTAPVPPQE